MYVFGKNYKQSSTKTFIITVDPNLNNCLWFYTDFDIEYNKYFDFFVDEPLANMLNLSNDVCYHANIYDLVKSNKYYWSFNLNTIYTDKTFCYCRLNRDYLVKFVDIFERDSRLKIIVDLFNMAIYNND